MGKEVIVDELVRDAFIYENSAPALGLLIGAEDETGEYCVAHLAQTLEDRRGGGEGKGDEGESQSSSSSDEIEVLHLEGKSFTLTSLDSVSHHAKQVIRMLPGGLFILGIYVVEPLESIFTTKYEATIKNLLSTLNKSLSRNVHYGAEFGANNEKIVFHYNPKTKKFNSRVFEGQSFKTQQMETSFARLEWSKLECEYDTLYAMHLAKHESGLPLKKNLRILMNSFQTALDSARFIINGKNPSKDVVYEEPAPPEPKPKVLEVEGTDSGFGNGDNSNNSSPRHGSESDSESENASQPAESPLHILIDKTPGVIRTPAPGEDFVNHLHLHGKIAAVAFVRSGSSTAFVVQMIKQDILRSLTTRIEMHCESLIEEEHSENEEGCSKIYHEVPRRVFARLLGSKLLVSDYLFPGEGQKDSVITFRDILTLRLESESDIIMTMEKPFNMEELRNKGSMEELMCAVNPVSIVPSELHHNRTMIWVIILGAFIAVFAAMSPFAYDYVTQSRFPKKK